MPTRQKIKLTSYEDLVGISRFGTDDLDDNSEKAQKSIEQDKVIRLPLSDLHDFNEHPFKVLDDTKMAETVESVLKYGVLVPGIVRRRKAGGYEIVAGHRRRRASELAGKQDMPVIIKELTDDEAIVIMVDSNIQRDDLSFSEKAYAYSMKYDALKRLGKQGQQEGEDTKGRETLRSDQILAKESGESRNTIQRYIRLTCLIPELLTMVDEKKLGFTVGAELSYLTHQEQQLLLQMMNILKIVPNGSQAADLKEYSKKKELSKAVMELLLARTEPATKVTISSGEISKYFPENYSKKQIEDIIFKLLEEWKQNNDT